MESIGRELIIMVAEGDIVSLRLGKACICIVSYALIASHIHKAETVILFCIALRHLPHRLIPFGAVSDDDLKAGIGLLPQ